jgi:signal transduction histidine kinase
MLPLPPDLAGASVLVVDDNPTNLNVLVDYLKEFGLKILIARDGESALNRAQLAKPDLILLDVMMPGLDGFEVCKRLKALESARDIPVIFMTALASTDDKVRGFDAGAVDYVTKPVQQAEVLARVTTHLRMRAMARQLQHFNAELEGLVTQRTQELQRAYAKLETMDHNKSDFIKVAAHELRTPLTAIEGYAQLLREDVEKPDSKLLLEAVLQGAKRLGAIINAMLDIARIDANLVDVTPADLVLSNVIEAVHSALAPALVERRLTLRAEGLSALPTFRADPDLIYKVFYHLLINAVKYTPDGKTITVRARPTPATAPAGLEIIVQDQGIGIDPQYHELIFEKFFQTGSAALHSSGITKFKGGGPGLGLSIARGIVAAHRGRLWVESPGADEVTCPGSAFYVWLPLEYA